MSIRKARALTKKTILILGAKSDIGVAVAHRYALAGYNIILAARESEKLVDHESDLRLRYDVEVTSYEFNATDTEFFKGFSDSLHEQPSIVICLVGYLGNQRESEEDLTEMSKVLNTNFFGPAAILNVFANKFEQSKTGVIVGVSSVAGERGRASNYVYGAAKAGLSVYLSGLRNRLTSHGVRVITVLPGFVETKMTSKMDLPKLLTVQPDQVASRIFDATISNKDIIYVSSIWRVIMLVIRNIPESIFKRLSL